MANLGRVGALFMALALMVSWSAPSSAVGGEEIQAPYRVEKYTQTTVTVDFGTVDPSPNEEQFREMTLLIASGPESATLKEFKEVCVHLCGEPSGIENEDDFGPTCHFVGIYTRSGKTGGEPLVALPGQVMISGWTPLVGKMSERGTEPSQWITDRFQKPVGGFVGEYRWADEEKTGSAVLVDRSMGPDFYAPPIVLNTCELEEYRNYRRLKCGSSADLLYNSSGDLLILSLGEYGNAAAQPEAEFSMGDTQNILVRVGLKAHSAFGILTRIGGDWTLLIRPLDYPLMC